MNNLIRKEIRRIQVELAELDEALSSDIEKAFIKFARIGLVQADIRDFISIPRNVMLNLKSLLHLRRNEC